MFQASPFKNKSPRSTGPSAPRGGSNSIPSGSEAAHVAAVLKEWFHEQVHQNRLQVTDAVNLPSLTELSTSFNTSLLTVHDGLLQLRRSGYDYALEGLDRPTRLWKIQDK